MAGYYLIFCSYFGVSPLTLPSPLRGEGSREEGVDWLRWARRLGLARELL